MEFTGRVAVVTGGSSGIGAAIAEALRKAGATVVTWDVSGRPDIPCDVSDEAAVDEAIRLTESGWGAPSVLVAAAGIGSGAPLLELPLAQWQRIFSVDCTGVFLSLRAVGRAMRDAGLDGSLLLVSSVNGQVADPGIAAYSTAKAAVFHLARVAAVELGPLGIRVNALGPGPTDTPMMAHLLTDAYRDEVRAATPLRRVGTPELIADAAVNILRSDWITGQAVLADGGSSLVTARSGRSKPTDEPPEVSNR